MGADLPHEAPCVGDNHKTWLSVSLVVLLNARVFRDGFDRYFRTRRNGFWLDLSQQHQHEQV